MKYQSKFNLIALIILLTTPMFSMGLVQEDTSVNYVSIRYDSDDLIANYLFQKMVEMYPNLKKSTNNQSDLHIVSLIAQQNNHFFNHSDMIPELNQSHNLSELLNVGRYHQQSSSYYPLVTVANVWIDQTEFEDTEYNTNRLDTLYFNTSHSNTFIYSSDDHSTAINQSVLAFHPASLISSKLSEIYPLYTGSLNLFINGDYYNYHSNDWNYTIGSDHINHTISIDTGYTYQDGTSITAYDYILTLKMLSGSCATLSDPYFYNMDFRAVNNNTLKITSPHRIDQDLFNIGRLYPTHPGFNQTLTLEKGDTIIKFNPYSSCTQAVFDPYLTNEYQQLSISFQAAGLYQAYSYPNRLEMVPRFPDTRLFESMTDLTPSISLTFSQILMYFGSDNISETTYMYRMTSLNNSNLGSEILSDNRFHTGYFLNISNPNTSIDHISKFLNSIKKDYLDNAILFPLDSIYPIYSPFYHEFIYSNNTSSSDDNSLPDPTTVLRPSDIQPLSQSIFPVLLMITYWVLLKSSGHTRRYD